MGEDSGRHSWAWALKTGWDVEDRIKRKVRFTGVMENTYLQGPNAELGEVSVRETSEIKGEENSLRADRRQFLWKYDRMSMEGKWKVWLRRRWVS